MTAITRTRRTRATQRARRLRTLRAAAIPAGIATITVYDYLSRHPWAAVGALLLAALTMACWSVRGRVRHALPRRTPRNTRAALRMTPSQFEHHVADLLRASGHTQVQVSGGSGDLGADVTGRTRDGRRIVVQCKRYGPDNPVGSPDIQRFNGTARGHHRADIAVLVTTSRFTNPAAQFARSEGIFLIDGHDLAQWQHSRYVPWS